MWFSATRTKFLISKDEISLPVDLKFEIHLAKKTSMRAKHQRLAVSVALIVILLYCYYFCSTLLPVLVLMNFSISQRHR